MSRNAFLILMALKLAGRTALITGASGEIGRATAIEFASEGVAAMVLHYNKSRQRAVEIARETEKLGCETSVLKADLSNPNQAKSLVNKTCAKLGGIDILVCMAGHPFSRRDWFAKFEDTTPEQFTGPITIDLLGNAYVAQGAIPSMKRRHGGNIVFVGSTLAITGDVVGISYSIAKAGLLALTRSLAQYLGPFNIRANALALGSIDTKATLGHLDARQRKALRNESSLRRFGKPREVARSIVFLSSDDSAFMTGQTMVVDGGYAMR